MVLKYQCSYGMRKELLRRLDEHTKAPTFAIKCLKVHISGNLTPHAYSGDWYKDVFVVLIFRIRTVSGLNTK